jgi:hypothetical protein
MSRQNRQKRKEAKRQKAAAQLALEAAVLAPPEIASGPTPDVLQVNSKIMILALVLYEFILSDRVNLCNLLACIHLLVISCAHVRVCKTQHTVTLVYISAVR